MSQYSTSAAAPSRAPTGVTLERVLRVCQRMFYVLGTLYALRLVTLDRNDWGVIGIVLLMAALVGLVWLLAAWALIFHPRLRTAALRLMVWSAAFCSIPLIIRTRMAEPVGSNALIEAGLLIVAAGLLWAIIRPRQIAETIPARLFSNRILNYGMLVGTMLAWLTIAIAWRRLAQADSELTGSGHGEAAAVLLTLSFAGCVAAGAVSLMVAVWGWLGYWRCPQHDARRHHVVQMLVSVPGLVIGAAAYVWLLSQRGG